MSTAGFERERMKKAMFVSDVVKALVEHGDGRYDYLVEAPFRYAYNESYCGSEELVLGSLNCKRANVHGDSLTAIMAAMADMLS